MKSIAMKSSLRTRLAFRFLKAMKKASKTSTSSASIRGAAYASMASAIGPKKAWSRAILRKIRARKLINIKRARKSRHHDRLITTNNKGNPRYNYELGGIIGDEELRDLSEVVPGGRAMDSCKLLNETAHYLKCLTAQVQIMTNILNHYSST